MNERLIEGFTLNFRVTKDNEVIGGYLKSTKNGTIPSELCGEEIIFVSHFPKILENITDDNILQVYKSFDGYCSMVGKVMYEGPYAEVKYLDVFASSVSDNLIGSLHKLNENLSKKEEKTHQKIYYRYGSDKYKLL